MRINEAPELLRQDVTRNGRHATDVAPAEPASPIRRADHVSISDAGRALAADNRGGTLTTERANEIRQRILTGAYDSLDMVEEVALRMLARGDL